MDTTLIRPEHEKFRTFYQSHLDFCEGNGCAAGLLDFFDRYHSIKLEHRKANQKYNDVAEQYNDTRSQDEGIYQSHTQEELSNYLMGLFSIKTIRKALEFLEDKKIISTHKNPNPRYQFDKTKYYEFHPEIFNLWIKKRINPEVDSRKANLPTRSDNFAQSNVSNLPYRERKFAQSKVQNLLLRKRNFTSAIYNKELNKDKTTNLNLTSEIGNKNFTTRSALVGSDFFDEKEIENLNLSSSAVELNLVAANQNHVTNICQDNHIAEALTSTQQVIFEEHFEKLLKKLSHKISAPKQLKQEMEFCLLDKTALSRCNNHFLRKLIAIEELIISGRWRTPYKMQQNVPAKLCDEKISQPLKHLSEQIITLKQTIASDEAFLKLLPTSEAYFGIRQQITIQNQKRQEEIQQLLIKQKYLEKETNKMSMIN